MINSSINENKEIQRAEQVSYDAINGQRQQDYQQPEGITMLGQLNREKPLSAITREMIQEYQEEQNKPFMIDGEARKYMKADYEPDIKQPTDITNLIVEIRNMYKARVDAGNALKDIDTEIGKLDNEYKNYYQILILMVFLNKNMQIKLKWKPIFIY